MTDEMLADISRWAEGYYPARAEPPPAAMASVTARDVAVLFAAVRTRRAHLALVDQEPFRRWLNSPELKAAARASWARTQEEATVPP